MVKWLCPLTVILTQTLRELLIDPPFETMLLSYVVVSLTCYKLR